MSDINEFISGACFIERKAKELPSNISPREDKGVNEPDGNMVIQDMEDEPQDDLDQGIIAQDKAENILFKITLGNLKFGDINFTSSMPKRTSEGGFENPKTPAYITNTVAMQTTINEPQNFGCLKDEQVDVQTLNPDTNTINVSPLGIEFESLYLPSLINRGNNMVMQFSMTETNRDYPRDVKVPKLSNKNSEPNLSMTKPHIYPLNVNISKLVSCPGDNVKDSWDLDGCGYKDLQDTYQDKKLQRMGDKETFISRLGHKFRDPYACANSIKKLSLCQTDIDTVKRKPLDHRKSTKPMNVQATDSRRSNRKRKIKGKERKFIPDTSLKSEIKQASCVPSVIKINDLVLPGQELYGSSSLKYKDSGGLGENKVVNEKEENVYKDSVETLSKRNKLKSIQNTRKCKIKPKKTEIKKEHHEDDVFDITPAKDTPWSPSQDVTEENAENAYKDATGSMGAKRTKRLHVVVDNIETERSLEREKGKESRGSRHVTLTGIGSGTMGLGEHGNIDTICHVPAKSRKGRYNQDMKIINVETIELFINHYDHLQTRAKHPYNRPVLAPEKGVISKRGCVNKDLGRKEDINYRNEVSNPIKNEIKRGANRVKNNIGHDRNGTPKQSVLMNEGLEGSRENKLSDDIIDPLKCDIKGLKMKRKDTVKDKIPQHSLKVRTDISNIVPEYPDISDRKFRGIRHSGLQKIKVNPIGEEKSESGDAYIESTAILANTMLSPIVEEQVECVNKETLNSTVVRIDPKQESVVQDDVSDIEILSATPHDDQPECEIEETATNNAEVPEIKAGRIRRLLKWFSCCLRPKVDE